MLCAMARDRKAAVHLASCTAVTSEQNSRGKGREGRCLNSLSQVRMLSWRLELREQTVVVSISSTISFNWSVLSTGKQEWIGGYLCLHTQNKEYNSPHSCGTSWNIKNGAKASLPWWHFWRVRKWLRIWSDFKEAGGGKGGGFALMSHAWCQLCSFSTAKKLEQISFIEKTGWSIHCSWKVI